VIAPNAQTFSLSPSNEPEGECPPSEVCAPGVSRSLLRVATLTSSPSLTSQIAACRMVRERGMFRSRISIATSPRAPFVLRGPISLLLVDKVALTRSIITVISVCQVLGEQSVPSWVPSSSYVRAKVSTLAPLFASLDHSTHGTIDSTVHSLRTLPTRTPATFDSSAIRTRLEAKRHST
jgi:hypothetical protein